MSPSPSLLDPVPALHSDRPLQLFLFRLGHAAEEVQTGDLFDLINGHSESPQIRTAAFGAGERVPPPEPRRSVLGNRTDTDVRLQSGGFSRLDFPRVCGIVDLQETFKLVLHLKISGNEGTIRKGGKSRTNQ